MPEWEVVGTFQARRATWQKFSKRHEAPSAELAREWALSEIGGCHGVPRRLIRIEAVTEARS